ncbi:MAG: ImmA/IrrE family metallo-endopeptidase [Candidatus Anammoxibacter sp.]
MTNKTPDIFEPEMKTLCAESGVVLVFVSEFKDTRLSGATCRYSKNNALIIMSLRYKKDDYFWFTFFHEAAHVLKHKSGKITIDGDKLKGNDMEDEANRFAADILIPPEDYRNFIDYTPRITEGTINKFAKKINIAPGIIVGRLQKAGKLKYSGLNKLKQTFELVE